MKIAVFNEKGGAGKTTLAVLLAKLLGYELIDLDSQQSGQRWLGPEPRQVKPGSWVLDCPPGLETINKDVIDLMVQADLVLIPVKTSYTDLVTVPQSIRFVRAQAKRAKVAFVGSMIDNRSSDLADLTKALAGYGYPIAGITTQRASYRRAGLVHGLAGDMDPVAAAEADVLIQYIKGL